jgi:pyruvate,water dikinase
MDGPARGEPTEGDVLRGTPASAGRVTAPVRVVRRADDLAAAEPGEILVCGHTTPAWSLAISVSAGLVATGGGDCCHAAIVAREFAIPAVVGVAGAFDALQTGDVVTLDGSAGTVAPLRR